MPGRISTWAAVVSCVALVIGASCDRGPAPDPATDPRAREVAEAFVQAMLSSKWSEAMQFVSNHGPSQEQIQEAHDYLVLNRFRRTGPPHFDPKAGFREGPAGFEFPMRGLQGGVEGPPGTNEAQWEFVVYVEFEDNEWWVIGYAYTVTGP